MKHKIMTWILLLGVHDITWFLYPTLLLNKKI